MDTDRPSADADPPPPTAHPDQPGRREFVRALGRDGVHSAGRLAGAMGVVSGLPVSVGAQFLGLGAPDERGGAIPAPARASRPPVTPSHGPAGPLETPDDRRPWRLDGHALHVLDQRELPGIVRGLQLDSAAAVAASLGTLATPFGVALGEIASAGVAMAARGVIGATAADRARALSWNLRLLRGARPSSAAIQVALARQEAVLATLPEDAAGDAVAAAVEAEVAAFAAHASEVSGAIGRAGADRLVGDVASPLRLLTLGSGGAASGGGSGTVGAVIAELVGRGRAVRAWVAETRPTLVGARIAAHELVRLGVPVTVLADGAVGALLEQVRIDVVLLTAERFLPGGDVLAVAGTGTVALLAARHGVPVWMVGPSWLATPPGPLPAAGLSPSRPASELGIVGGTRFTPGRAEAFVPLLDRTAAHLISRLVSEPHEG